LLNILRYGRRRRIERSRGTPDTSRIGNGDEGA